MFCSQFFLFPFLKVESIFATLPWGHFAIFIILQQAPRVALSSKGAINEPSTPYLYGAQSFLMTWS